MHYTRFIASIALGIAFFSGHSHAQGPDVRSIPPVVMLLVDTSGSMEKVGNCACQTPNCVECLPDCRLATPERNRWNTVVEALTGSYSDYTCTVEDRTGYPITDPDYRYFLPHVNSAYTAQRSDGILDVYVDRVRFGLMTFDATSTFAGEGELMPQTDFMVRIADNPRSPGGFSYGGERPFSFPGCGAPYMIDNGARGEGSFPGATVSVGDENDLTRTLADINADVQASLQGIRPYGATPIAGMLSDLDYYFHTHPDVRRGVTGASGDPFFSCRRRYGILLTDGRPNQDMRGNPVNCDALAAGVGATGCPYDTPVNTTARLISDERMDGLFVVGFDIDAASCGGDAACITRANSAVRELNDIAAAGGTESAVFANDRDSLTSTLVSILDRAAPGTTTRTVPAFSNGATGGTGSRQLQFNTGFNVSTFEDDPWTGRLERRRIECDGLNPVVQPIGDEDRFHELLNTQTSRRLVTAVPPSPADANGHITNDENRVEALTRVSVTPNGARGVLLSDWNFDTATTRFWTDNVALTDTLANGIPPSRVQEILEWVHGTVGSERENNRLGAIVHSSPTIVSAPSLDTADESYNAFRLRREVARRPSVLYVGTNDGVLHAFAADNYCPDDGEPSCTPDELAATPTIAEGTELWGFIPPILFEKFDSLLGGHQWMADGSPIIRDIFDARALGAAADAQQYRTVLLSGLRQGGNGFFALDITNPLDPEFMWQYSDPDLGETYAEPALAQVRVTIDSIEHERGIAILPGGHGETTGGTEAATGAAVPGTVEGVTSPRTVRREWRPEGRKLVILDVATGAVLRHWGPETFPAPLVGGVSVYPGNIGALATRAFFTDADGVIWRADFSSSTPGEWSVHAFHDIFHGGTATDGQPAYNAPIISVNERNEVIVIQSTGDIDRLEDPNAQNRVVSLTEVLTFNTSGDVTETAGRLNWQISLAAGEQATGPLELFNSSVYFGTFTSSSDPLNACEVGFSRLWGVEYLRNESGTPGPSLPLPALELDEGSGVFDRRFLGPAELPELSNRLIMGVATTRRPTCVDATEASVTDPYLGSYQTYRVNRTSQPQYELTALLGGRDTDGATGASIQEFTRPITPPAPYTSSRAYLPFVD